MKAEDSIQAQSLRKQLSGFTQEWGASHLHTLRRYAVEGLLRRLSISRHSDRYILKGAMLFTAWYSRPFRVSQDVDFLNLDQFDYYSDRKSIGEICGIEIEEDGLAFDPKFLKALPIGGHQANEGIRVKTLARLGKAKIPLQVDIGYGDVVFPAIEQIEFPSMLFDKGPMIKAYPKESVVAEKLEAIVSLGWKNSRMKDFYDLYAMSQLFGFDGEALAKAIRATFEGRATSMQKWPPNGMSDGFSHNAEKLVRWDAFLKQALPVVETPDFAKVVERIVQFAGPPANAFMSGQRYNGNWRPGGPWVE